MTDKQTLLEFPCAFPIKVFGNDDGYFADTVFTLVKAHVPELALEQLQSKPSRGGRYLAVTVHIQARSQTQLDAIYKDISDSPAVLMAL